MPSAPINSVSPASSVDSSSGLYVPVHKRSSSVTRTDDSMSTTSSSRPSSRAESHAELGAEHSETGDGHPLVYSRDRLMALAKSPLATISKELKDELRERLPEIVLSRKHRKAMEYRAMQQQRAQPQVQAQGQPRPPVQAQQANNAHNTGSNHVESAQQQQQAFTGTIYTHRHEPVHDHRANQPGRVQQQSQKQPHIYSHTTQNHGQAAVPRNPHPRPAGRSWWNAPKQTADEMSWRRATGPASISVA